MRIGIDATNVGGGGGITHLREIIENIDLVFTSNVKIESIVIFASEAVLSKLSDHPKVIQVTNKYLNSGLLKRIYFQLFLFDRLLLDSCDILFSVTGDFIGRFKPVIGMSRNMLLYERDIWKEIKDPKEIIRFYLNFLKQKHSFSNSKGIIFISKYAEDFVSKNLQIQGKKTIVINHGVSTKFRGTVRKQKAITEYNFSNPFKFIYVSTVHVYKHQWNVVEAVANMRSQGYPVELILIGGVIFKPSGERLIRSIENFDPNGKFIRNVGHIPYSEIETHYKNADGIIFASTCENMPNTLIESMASGLPILCSNKAPMPEFLKNCGQYFDPYSVDGLTSAMKDFLDNPDGRFENAKRAQFEVSQYSWEKTTEQTFRFILSMTNS